MISQYGADLARGSAFSGALERQRDYAQGTRSYVTIVPGSPDAAPVTEGALTVMPTARVSTLGFMQDAYDLAIRLHAEESFDALMVDNPHLMGMLGLVLRAKLGVPLMVHQMADMAWNHWYDRERRTNIVKQYVMRFVMRRADMIRVSTRAEVDRLVAEGIPEARIACVPFYIDRARFAEAIAAAEVTRGPNRAVYVGRLGSQKDVATLVRACVGVVERVPEFRLTIVGDGPDRQRLERLAHELGIAHAIEFRGAIPRSRIAGEFVRASLFALPSLYEGTCMVLHEAALAGLPIVSTENAGARDFIRPGTDGELVRVRDHRAMAHAIATILTDQATWQRMSRSVYERGTIATRDEALASWNEALARIATGAQV